MKKRAFGNLEQSVLKILGKGRKMTVQQMVDALAGDDKYTTIMTVMTRLYKKGFLDRERVGNGYVYWLLKNEESQKALFARLRDKLFGVRPTELVSYLVDEADDLSSEDLAKIEKMIAEAKRKRGGKDE